MKYYSFNLYALLVHIVCIQMVVLKSINRNIISNNNHLLKLRINQNFEFKPNVLDNSQVNSDTRILKFFQLLLNVLDLNESSASASDKRNGEINNDDDLLIRVPLSMRNNIKPRIITKNLKKCSKSCLKLLKKIKITSK